MALAAVILPTGCATPPKVIDRPRVVEIKVPVIQPVDPELTKDCEPQFQYGEQILVSDLISRLVAVEACRAQLSDQLAKIRR